MSWDAVFYGLQDYNVDFAGGSRPFWAKKGHRAFHVLQTVERPSSLKLGGFGALRENEFAGSGERSSFRSKLKPFAGLLEGSSSGCSWRLVPS